RAAPTDPRVVHEDVDTARACDDLLHAPAHGCIVIDVEGDRSNLQLVALNRRRELGRSARTTNAGMNLVTEPREVARGGEADAAAATRDQDDGHGPLRFLASLVGAAILCDEESRSSNPAFATPLVRVGKTDTLTILHRRPLR